MRNVTVTDTDMLPAASQDAQTLLFWVEEAKSDPIVSKVLTTKAFKRLKDISFLGAIDYTNDSGNSSRASRSRAHHSLNVAGLANYVATHRNYDATLKRHLVLAGLLHDIGHLPLSHSAEPVFKAKVGVGHHHLGEQLLRGEITPGKELSGILKNGVDIEFIVRLISGEVSETDGGDLFSSAINIDTIDGIIRSYGTIMDEPHDINRLAVAKASFIDQNSGRYAILDAFWHMKDFVYKYIIHSKSGLLADFKARAYFEDIQSSLNEMELLVSEKQWRKNYKCLFDQLSDQADIPQPVIDFTQRHYVIFDSYRGANRYRVEKEVSQMPLDEPTRARFPEQYSFRLERAQLV